MARPTRPGHTKSSRVQIKPIPEETNKQPTFMTKRIVLMLFATVALVVGAVGCRTAHGAGEDIENAGQKIQEHTPP
jgi:predicted small secreted protein